jgi:hypothetical protein
MGRIKTTPSLADPSPSDGVTIPTQKSCVTFTHPNNLSFFKESRAPVLPNLLHLVDLSKKCASKRE